MTMKLVDRSLDDPVEEIASLNRPLPGSARLPPLSFKSLSGMFHETEAFGSQVSLPLTEPDEKKQDVCQTRAVRDECLQLGFHKIAPRMSVPEFERSRGAQGNLADEWIAWEGGQG